MSDAATAFDGGKWEEALARFRPLLRLLAALDLNPRFWRQVDPSDMVQKTIIEAHQKRSDFRGSTEQQLEAWLKGILAHRIIDEARKLRCEKNDVGREEEAEKANDLIRKRTSPLSALVRHEETLRLAVALEQLSDDHRGVVERIHLHGLTLAETAELMSKTKGAVASLLHRALARLRELLKNAR